MNPIGYPIHDIFKRITLVPISSLCCSCHGSKDFPAIKERTIQPLLIDGTVYIEFNQIQSQSSCVAAGISNEATLNIFVGSTSFSKYSSELSVLINP